MSNIDKRALREAANAANAASWGNWESYKPHKGARGYEVKVGVKAVAQHCLKVDSVFIAAANPITVLALLDEITELEQRHCGTALLEREEMHTKTLGRMLDELEAAEKRIAELEVSHSNLREAMAAIHNTITGGGAYTPLAAILNASKRAYEESAAAAGKGEAS
ncbi:ead/Ea22-like family protein [Enterobacter roggenkampii]|uniref:ead/Ea22-like family protein n=1 Tax=Enterobacter roggenkampii TaxID=1812935 RepID=UPI00189A8A0C|nr:ead/Ea22-like family protein [Enterobacter roggenkampii]